MPYGQVLIGKQFVNRYKKVNYQVCCPAYIHFYQDQELWCYAKSVNKFVFCKDATLIHYYPCKFKNEMDETHKIVRQPKIKQKDIETYKKRQSLNLIWGESWEI